MLFVPFSFPSLAFLLLACSSCLLLTALFSLLFSALFCPFLPLPLPFPALALVLALILVLTLAFTLALTLASMFSYPLSNLKRCPLATHHVRPLFYPSRP